MTTEFKRYDYFGGKTANETVNGVNYQIGIRDNWWYLKCDSATYYTPACGDLHIRDNRGEQQ